MALGWFLRKLEYRSRFLDNHLFLNFYQFLQNFFKVKEGEIDFVISERFFGFVLAANIKKLRFFRSREKNLHTEGAENHIKTEKKAILQSYG